MSTLKLAATINIRTGFRRGFRTGSVLVGVMSVWGVMFRR